MKSLDRKVLRELWSIRGQVMAIAIVIAAGLSTVVMSYVTLASLKETREQYYLEYGFPDLFVSLKRAPLTLLPAIESIQGVQQVQPRVVAPARITLEDYDEPIQGQLVGISQTKVNAPNSLNRIYLKEGRLPAQSLAFDGAKQSGRIEVLVSEAFAEPHDLHPGDKLSIIVNGKQQLLLIVGVALSPEYIYQIAPGTLIPDFERYGIIWIDHDFLESTYDMQDAFNDLAIRINPQINPEAVIEKLDEYLKTYGGLGAYDREKQVSHLFLSEEFKQLDAMGRSFSIIFLGVTILLLNMVLGRMIASEREIIASLKAFGFSHWNIAVHYSKLVLGITIIGIVLGVATGLFLGEQMAQMYIEYYRLPYLSYQLQWPVLIYSTGITLLASLTGAWFSIRKAVRLQPAEAMQPEIPYHYSESWVERLGLKRYLSQPSRMIIRHLQAHPVKSAFSVLGSATACAIMIVGTFFMDAMDFMLESEFYIAQREDLDINFINPTSYKAVYELNAMQGITRVEPYRRAAVKIIAEHRNHRTSLIGLSPDNHLHQLLDANNKLINIPGKGLVISDFLAQKLAVKKGDWLSLEFLDGKRLQRKVPVVGINYQYIGLSAYMNRAALNELLQEGSVISGAWLAIDDRSVIESLKQLPQVAGVAEKDAMLKSFNDTVADFLLSYIVFISGLSMIIAFGVIYNNARITLAERNRELASLRVLGFTHHEVSRILLGELTLITILAIPLGLLMGYWLSYAFISGLQQELFRIPLIIHADTYAQAVLVILCAAILSGWMVRQKLTQVDLVAMLKVRE